MHSRHLLIIAIVGGTLVACGGGKHTAPGAGQARAGQAEPASGNASAKQVAAQARGDVDCPAEVKTTNLPGTPMDDVVGLRPGMSYEEAANVVLCSNPLLVVTPETGRGFQLDTYGQKLRQGFTARFAEPRVYKTGRQIVQEMERDAMDRGLNAARHDMKPGQSKWFVGTMGLPGQEKVLSAAREEWYDEGRNPTVDSIEQALLAKYGTLTRRQDGGSYHQLYWSYDPRGRLITETSPLYGKCQGAADPDAGVNLSPDCGIAVAAMIQSLSSNPALGQYLQVGVVDQAGGYQLLTDTQQRLQAMDATRRAKQVQEAGENAQAPQL